MRLISLLLIPVFFILAFFAAYTPVEAVCTITSSPPSLAPSSPLVVMIQGTPGMFFTAQLKESGPGGNNVGSPNSTLADATSGDATFNLTAPSSLGDFIIEITGTDGSTCSEPITIDPNAPSVSNPNEPAAIGGIVTIIKNIIRLLVPFAALAFLAMMIIGGFQFLLSGGDPKAAGAARSTLTFAIIGIILVVVSWLILLLIKNVTGVDVTTVEIPGLGQ